MIELLDRHTRIVVEMAAERCVAESLTDLSDHSLHLVRQEPSVGVAQHQLLGACVVGHPQRCECKVPIVLVPVEEVLSVEEDPTALRAQVLHRIADHLDRFLVAGAQGVVHVIVPRLADEADHVGLGRQQRGELFVVLRTNPCSPCRAEGDER